MMPVARRSLTCDTSRWSADAKRPRLPTRTQNGAGIRVLVGDRNQKRSSDMPQVPSTKVTGHDAIPRPA